MNDTTRRRELEALLQELSIAERLCDIQQLDRLVADDYLGVTATGELITKEILLQRFSTLGIAFEHHQVEDVTIRVYDSTGIITGYVTMRGQLAQDTFGGRFAFTDICIRRGEGWEVVCSHMTPVIS